MPSAGELGDVREDHRCGSGDAGDGGQQLDAATVELDQHLDTGIEASLHRGPGIDAVEQGAGSGGPWSCTGTVADGKNL